MASLLEQYKTGRDIQQTDAELLQKLYKESSYYQRKYEFDDFVYEATKNSDKPITPEVKKLMVGTPKPPVQDYKKLFTDESVEPQIISKEKRRTIGGIYDKVIQGTANFLGDAIRTGISPYDIPSHYAKMYTNPKYKKSFKQMDKLQREFVSEYTNKFTKPLFGADIYDNDVLQEPETTGGQVTKDIGAFLAEAAILKSPRTSANRIKNMSENAKKAKVTKETSELTKSWTSKAKASKSLSSKYNQALKTIAKGELTAQIVFADNPEMMIVAEYLNDKVKKNELSETQLGKIIDWLDADMDDSAAQRRLSLLLDGGVFAGLFGAATTTIGKVVLPAGKKGYNVTKEGVSKALMAIKKNPQAVKVYKKTLQPVQEAIQKRIPTQQVDDVFVKAEGDDIFTKFLNGARQFRRGFFTSRGLKSQEMFDIIKRADSSKLAIKKEARNLFDTINYRIKQAAKNENLSVEDLNTLLNDFMVGKITIKELPALLRQPSKEARKYIDDLSSQLLDSPLIDKQTRNIIRLNLGKYLRQSYEKFENPNYKPSKEVYDKAIQKVAEAIHTAPKQLEMFGNTADDIARETLPSQQTMQQAKNIVDEILSGGTQYKGLDFNTSKYLDEAFGQLNLDKKLATTKQIDEAIKDLLGQERQNTSTAIFRSITNLGTLLSDMQLYDDLYRTGQGKWFFKEGDKYLDEAYRTAGRIGDDFGALSGARTTPEIAELFNRMQRGEPLGIPARLWSSLLTAKGFGQAFATVYSFTTHARNTIGGAWIMASNGLNPFDRETRDAFKILRNDIFSFQKNKKKAFQDLYVKYQRLGIVNQNVRKGEFTDLINEAANVNWMNKAGQEFNKLKTAKRYAKAANDAIVKTYVAEDDLWRIASFQKELKVLQKAFPNRSLQELEEEAAKIIRNTMPTYDMVPEYAKNFRKLPFGNFFSFHAERWRNNYHTVRQGIEEIRSGNEELITRGYQRIGSKLSLGYLGATGISEATKMAYGVTNEEEQALRDLQLPFWSENSTIAFKRDQYGRLQWVDLSYSDPDAPVMDVLKASLDVLLDPKTPIEEIDNLLVESIYAGSKNFIKPFMSETLLAEALLQSYTGRDSETGEYIKGYSPQNSGLENALAIIYHIGFGVLTPAQIKETIQLPEQLSKGKTTISDYLVSELTGQKFYTVDQKSLNTSLYFKTKEFSDAKQEIDKLFREGIKDVKSTEDLLQLYVDVNDKLYDDAVRLNKAIRAARTLNISEEDIELTAKRQLSRAGFDSSEINNLIEAGLYFTPYRLKERTLSEIYDLNNFNTLSFDTFITEYDKLYEKLSNLPLVKFDKEIDVEVEAAKIRNTGYRLQKATGGLIEGPEVPFTKENPADRVDPFTGEPYQEQMSRLGFNKGGEILKYIQQARGYEDIEFLKNYSDDVKWQESRGAGPKTVQLNDGPARGSYQVEGSQGSSRNETILNRAAKFYEKYPNAPKSKEIQYALEQRGKDLDFSTLSEDTQDALFYMDAERGNLPLDDLASGKLDNRNAWVTYWNQDPKALKKIQGQDNPNFEQEILQKRLDDWDKAQQEKLILLQQQN